MQHRGKVDFACAVQLDCCGKLTRSLLLQVASRLQIPLAAFGLGGARMEHAGRERGPCSRWCVPDAVGRAGAGAGLG